MFLTALLTIIVLSLSAILTIEWFWSQWSNQKMRQKFAKQNLPFVPMPNIVFQAFRGKRIDLLMNDLTRKYGKMFGTEFFGGPAIVLAQPELIQLIMSKEFSSFPIRQQVPDSDDPIASAFLTMAQGEQWKRIRTIVSPTFSTGKLKRMKPKIEDTCESLIKNFEQHLSKTEILNVRELYGFYIMDTIIQTAFGTKVESLDSKNSKIIEMAKTLFTKDITLTDLMFMKLFQILPFLAKHFPPNKEMENFFARLSAEIIKQKRQELKSRKTTLDKANNFLELLLEAEAENEILNSGEASENHKKSSKFITTDEMIAQCILFFTGGYDTTTTTLSMVSYCLALNPLVQERLYEEIETKLEKLHLESEENVLNPSALITFENIGQFEYLNAVISETLRVYPPTGTQRYAARDIDLLTEDGSHRLSVKMGDLVSFNTYALHHDPANFPNPEQFEPERFLGEPTFHKCAYLPFGNGPRNCIGRRLALMETSMAILNVVHRYRLSACERTMIPMQFYNNGQILSPRDIFLKVERR